MRETLGYINSNEMALIPAGSSLLTMNTHVQYVVIKSLFSRGSRNMY